MISVVDRILHFLGFRDTALDKRLETESPLALVMIQGFRLGVVIGIIAIGLFYLWK